MPRQTLAFVSLLISLLPVGLLRAQSDTPTAAITGTVAYRLRVALPEDATVEVRLEDVSLQDAPAKVLAKLAFPTEGKQVPLPFRIMYDPTWITPSNRYSLRATISANGQMLFTTTTSNPVITQGAPTQVDLILEQVGSGAQAQAATVPVKVADLEGTYWKLTALGDKPTLKGIGGTEAYLILHANDKRIAGSSGCNRMAGNYELTGGSLHFAPAGMTMMACSPALMKQEQAFGAALKVTTSYRIDGQRLELLNGSTVQASFQAKYLK